MKKLITLFILLVMGQNAFSQITTETFSSGRLNRKQKIAIYKPEKYSDKDTYPLLVVLGAETLMEPVVSAVRYYESYGDMPKCIVVGVIDANPEDVTIIDEVAHPMNESARFFEFVSAELVPYIQGKFPIASLKGIIATDEAGFLANYYLLQQKPTFNFFVSLNPIGTPRIGEEIAQALAAGSNHRIVYYMATTDVENKKNYERVVQLEKSIRTMPVHATVNYYFEEFKNLSINAVNLNGIARALDYCFDIYKPIGGKEFKTKIEPLETGIFDYLEKKYQTIYDYLGVKKKPTLNDVMATYTAITRSQDWESLQKLAKYVGDNGYFKTAMPDFFLAEYYEKTGDNKKALKTYQKSYTQPSIDFITGDLISERITRMKGTRTPKKSKKEVVPEVQEEVQPTEEVKPDEVKEEVKQE